MLRSALFIILINLLIISACNNKNDNGLKSERTFYYWKTVFQLSSYEKKALSSLKINKIYLRFFDVDWSESDAQAIPKGKLVVKTGLPSLTIVPVIYITNKTFKNLMEADIRPLAQNCIKGLKSIQQKNKISYKEIQIDCDWSDSTRDKYFRFLQELQILLPNISLSATIRLHQVKYSQITGVPPVNRGMLMFYNMGKLTHIESRNSIYNENDASTYIATIKNYPLELDVVLPVFEWCIHIRNNKIIGLISKNDIFDFASDSNFVKQANGFFLANDSFYRKGRYIKRGDLFKLEKVEDKDLLSGAKLISKELKKNKRSVALFDLDKVNILRYDKDVLEEVFDTFD